MDKEFTIEDEEFLNPSNKISIANALRFIYNPVKLVHEALDAPHSHLQVLPPGPRPHPGAQCPPALAPGAERQGGRLLGGTCA